MITLADIQHTYREWEMGILPKENIFKGMPICQI